ncbi:hypothetical protein IEO21_04824 [Rhodonia placenta]|uniref:Uncharacterized protein n=2 Tax=Rhodonia placenta TaxID=104341 RepID=A0A1X6MMB1_9APHY|nr:hypothetical protein POSPLADRAFT_1037117 [Postia placenta MAD-698-R-SB12]KAF9814974.1 hypothetical protein IEO21_04824 [Postia placenta]OSX57302.1 hypothetical protein POSPLADRAFT_1037117 [Postia placenta MAD-698-R-SB12]
MAYNITVHTTNNSGVGFSIVEKTLWNKGIWSSRDGVQLLSLSESGASGMLRYRNNGTGESFIVALGIHQRTRWCDVIMGLDPKDTATPRHALYYELGKAENQTKRQLHTAVITEPTATGRQVTVQYGSDPDNSYNVNVTISDVEI